MTKIIDVKCKICNQIGVAEEYISPLKCRECGNISVFPIQDKEEFDLPEPDPNRDQNINKSSCGEGGCE